MVDNVDKHLIPTIPYELLSLIIDDTVFVQALEISLIFTTIDDLIYFIQYMQINDLYYQKYLKYKDKYLNLESQIGGGRFTGNKLTHNSQKQKILIQKHKQERNNLAQA